MSGQSHPRKQGGIHLGNLIATTWEILVGIRYVWGINDDSVNDTLVSLPPLQPTTKVVHSLFAVRKREKAQLSSAQLQEGKIGRALSPSRRAISSQHPEGYPEPCLVTRTQPHSVELDATLWAYTILPYEHLCSHWALVSPKVECRD